MALQSLSQPTAMVNDQAKGLSPSKEQLNRNTIKRIKKMLVMQDNQYESLRSKFLGQPSGGAGGQQADGGNGTASLAETLPMSEKKARKSRDDPFLQQIVQSDIKNEPESAREDPCAAFNENFEEDEA